MHIALVNAFFRSSYIYKCDVKESGGLAALGAYLRANGYAVTILEPALQSLDVQRTAEKLIELDPDVIGLSLMAGFFGYSSPGGTRVPLPLALLLDALRRKGYGRPIILGGVYPSVLGHQIIDDFKELDAVVIQVYRESCSRYVRSFREQDSRKTKKSKSHVRK